ncbi:uncharacterized protein PGTG_21384 [Puccinia graminis f. sp. tritici CRL 75-36-700-3]|uniref:Retrotransposon Copia-like N-terminal domain-containing protein n=1 Tax=Puccinia graminis f. sp. tritici (strain CRL 75-36-700-3 / race SCCL) TaxID=418459 RepID=H6QRF2_PUCGT|nr:uncharacterized protein PGTG_21384 [Puccinia graminis f. sp. tritici CRL 75-36-700-3]EHS63234.1 hypothetical protein PGTG_21384 [Puccinia graminis f. sp. tritici CRL 75-36-700-3]
MANNTLNPLNPSINLIPKLEDTNFFEWKRTITGHLTAMGKLKYIKSEVVRPEDDAAAEIFIQERAQVLQAIRLTISKENRSAIIHFDDPHCAFKALEEKHGSNDAFMIASTIAVRLKSGCENPFAEWRRVWWSCKLCPSILSDNKTHQA